MCYPPDKLRIHSACENLSSFRQLEFKHSDAVRHLLISVVSTRFNLKMKIVIVYSIFSFFQFFPIFFFKICFRTRLYHSGRKFQWYPRRGFHDNSCNLLEEQNSHHRRHSNSNSYVRFQFSNSDLEQIYFIFW